MRNISKNSFIEALEDRKNDVYVRILQDVSFLKQPIPVGYSDDQLIQFFSVFYLF
jgi:hypothetical protein